MKILRSGKPLCAKQRVRCAPSEAALETLVLRWCAGTGRERKKEDVHGGCTERVKAPCQERRRQHRSMGTAGEQQTA